MISRLTIAATFAVLGATLFASPAPAQVRGMRASPASPRARSSFKLRGREGLARQSQRRFLNESGFLFPPYFYPDDEFDYEPEAPPAQTGVAQPAQSPAPAASPIEPLLLENHDGQWVRVPTGNQMAITQTDSLQTSNLQPGIAQPAYAAPPLTKLPPAVIVFRDGHMEEMGKYLIQGDFLYAASDYWTTGSWTRKIPLAELDIPASLKLNKERGAKFNLPSAPNEVVVRF